MLSWSLQNRFRLVKMGHPKKGSVRKAKKENVSKLCLGERRRGSGLPWQLRW